MKYQSELIDEIVESRGHKKSSIHYESECKETWIKENEMAYPKLIDYEGEWLNYINENHIGEFPYQTLTDVTDATVENVVPYAYKSAILKGSTKYRDIDTGEVLDAFEDGRNLELVSVKMPVLTTTGKNLFDGGIERGGFSNGVPTPPEKGWQEYIRSKNFTKVNSLDFYTSINTGLVTNINMVRIHCYDENYEYISAKAITEQKPTNTKYIKITAQTLNNPADLSLNYNIQIEEGSVATSYEPYKTNILTVNEDVTLRSNGSVCDELDLLTGKLTQRIDEDGEILTQDVVKTVDLTTINENGEQVIFKPIEGTMHISTSGETIKPTFSGEIPVEAITQNLESFIGDE